MRSRVASPAALRVPVSPAKVSGSLSITCFFVGLFRAPDRYKDIFISLNQSKQAKLGHGPRAARRSGTPLAAVPAACEFSSMAKLKKPKKVLRKTPASNDPYALRGGE